MANTTTSSNSNLLSQHWNKLFLDELRESMVFYDLAMASKHPLNSGTTVHWLSIADISATTTALTEATDPTAYALSAGDVTAAVKEYGASVKLSDLFQDTAIGNTVSTIIERVAKRNAAKTLDIIVRDTVFTASTNVRYGGTAVARNSIATDGSFDFSVTTIRKAKNFFSNANAMPFSSDEFMAIAHPDVIYDIQGDSNWTNAQIYTSQVEKVYKGEVGKLYGVRFMQNTNALFMDASGSASTDVYQTYFVGHEGFGVSELMNPQVIIKSPHPASDLDLYSTVGWKAKFATRELVASALLRYETGASLGT